jgi:hypothetical protein
MIVKPKPYSKDELGGYLLNDVEYDEELIKKKMSYGETSIIEDIGQIFFDNVHKIITGAAAT